MTAPVSGVANDAQASRGGRRARIAAIALLYSVAAVAVTWPTARHPSTAMVSPFGDPLLNTWILAWGADRALHAFQGFWAGLFFYPYADTVAYSEHLLGLVLFTAPLQWLTGNPVLVYNVALVASSAGAGLGAWLLARELSGRDDAAVVAGLAYACTPFRLVHLTHLQVLVSIWIPVALWALHCYLRRGDRRALCAFVIAVLLNAWSNGYYLYFAVVPIAIVLADGAWQRREHWKRLSRELGLAAAAIMAGLLPIAAAYARVRYEQGLTRSHADLLLFSPALEDYVRPSPTSLVWGWLAGRASERALFPGLTVAILALLAIVSLVRGRTRLLESHRRPVALYAAVLATTVVLSLGPRPTAFGHAWPFEGPYGWLATLVPGLSGLRVPARLGMIVALSLAVLAGLGLDALTRRWTRTSRRLLMALCGVALLVEGLPSGQVSTTLPTPDMLASQQAYAWLRGQPPGPMLELPIGDTAQKVRYVYGTLLHRHPIVNGYSGYRSALQEFVRVPFDSPERLDEALVMSRALGVRWLAVHTGSPGGPARAIARAVHHDTTHVLSTWDFGAVTVAELRPLAPPNDTLDPSWKALAVPPSHATASQHGEWLPLALDGDLATKWSSGGPQAGREWVALAFDQPVDVACVRLEMGRDTANYPRGLLVSGSEDGLHDETLFAGPVADRLALGHVRDPRAPSITLPLPTNRTRLLRIAVTGTATREWSVSELRVWAR